MHKYDCACTCSAGVSQLHGMHMACYWVSCSICLCIAIHLYTNNIMVCVKSVIVSDIPCCLRVHHAYNCIYCIALYNEFEEADLDFMTYTSYMNYKGSMQSIVYVTKTEIPGWYVPLGRTLVPG